MSDISSDIANRFDSRACFDSLYSLAAEHVRSSPEVQAQMQVARSLSIKAPSIGCDSTGKQSLDSRKEVQLDPTKQADGTDVSSTTVSDNLSAEIDFPEPMLEALRSAKHIYVFTGAGVSAESGIPTFRDKLTGLWERYKPSDLSTPSAFRRDPPLVWGWHEMQRWTAKNAKPNPAHFAIADLARAVARLTVVTQNVDSLHEQAGNTDVIHLHGSLQEPRCIDCAMPYLDIPKNTTLPEEGQRISPPFCHSCSGLIRPGVVWFGEPLPESSLNGAFEAAIESDVMIVVGTSGVVYPAAEIPRFAWQAGCVVIHINMQPVDTRDQREFSLAGPAGSVLPRLIDTAFSIDK